MTERPHSMHTTPTKRIGWLFWGIFHWRWYIVKQNHQGIEGTLAEGRAEPISYINGNSVCSTTRATLILWVLVHSAEGI